jgi:proteasome lid subunit RPN8/RPN11
MVIQQPIFIIGSARSGTILLGEILKQHPEIHCLIERPSVFKFASSIALQPQEKLRNREHICDQLFNLYQEAWSLDEFDCSNCSDICKKKGGFNSQISTSCQDNALTKRWADKSHQHVLNVDLLLEVFPEAQFIHIIRDGRDVVASMLQHPGVLAWFSNQYINRNSTWPQPWFGVNSLEHFHEWKQWSLAKKCALRWQSWVHAGLEARRKLHSHQWLDLRYEELVTSPEENYEKIFSFLDLPYIEGLGPKAHSKSVGKWKNELNESDIKDILDVAKISLKKLNYIDVDVFSQSKGTDYSLLEPR